MIARFNSVRSKVWLCVAIALFGYFIATLLGFYINVSQYQRLSHFQKDHLELVLLGYELQAHLDQQTEEFEDAFLIGEQELFIQANEETGKIIAAIDRLSEAINSASHEIAVPSLEEFKARYVAFSIVAQTLHIDLENSDFSLEGQKKIQRFGQQQKALLDDAQQIMTRLNVSLDVDMEDNRNTSIHSIIVLAALFFVVLLLVTLFVGRVSGRLLVWPLIKLQRDFKAVERGFEIEQPQQVHASDEIGQLSSSFWDLTQQLKQTTVSKRYVENIIRSMSGALIVLSAECTIVKVNTQAVHLFGYQEGELQGRSPEFLFANEADYVLLDKFFNESAHVKELKDLEVLATHSSGTTFPAHFSGSSMYDDDGSLDGIICVFNDITSIKETENQLIQLAHHDALTGLPNRNLFFDRVEQALHDGRRHGRTFALLYLDLDNFKPLNDTLGHEVGDKALCEISSRLKRSLRADDTVARVGGDEFIIILNALTCASDAQTLAQNIIDVVTEPFVFGHISHKLGVSVGISMFPNDGTSADTLIATADRAMYHAKQSGGNTFYPMLD